MAFQHGFRRAAKVDLAVIASVRAEGSNAFCPQECRCGLPVKIKRVENPRQSQVFLMESGVVFFGDDELRVAFFGSQSGNTAGLREPDWGGGRITVSRLCPEIVQVKEASAFNEDLRYAHLGRDISCNLGSLNVAATMDGPDFGTTIETAIRALAALSEMSAIDPVPRIRRGNDAAHAVGVGQMNLRRSLAREPIHCGSAAGVEFSPVHFAAVACHALRAANLLAREHSTPFYGFAASEYADGCFFERNLEEDRLPALPDVARVFVGISDGFFREKWPQHHPAGQVSQSTSPAAFFKPISSKKSRAALCAGLPKRECNPTALSSMILPRRAAARLSLTLCP
ncbi:hypothetical protein [Phaeovulum sp. W22_SRMD_FR3]|uniref:hypothetical protein n=1 Tax=Phaeovulum sp. W22_SRMD_FR3 TaxID=3240274 RepID=UPI003F9D3683